MFIFLKVFLLIDPTIIVLFLNMLEKVLFSFLLNKSLSFISVAASSRHHKNIIVVTKVHTSAQCATTKRRITKREVKIQNAVIDIKAELETKQNKTNQTKKNHLNAYTVKQDIMLLHSGCTQCFLH